MWDTSSGDCVRTLTGHFESVEGVCLVTLPTNRPGKGDGNNEKQRGGKSRFIVSVSLDGTLRRWQLDGEDEPGDVEGEAKEEDGDADGSKHNYSTAAAGNGNGRSCDMKAVTTTEEEDKELADLMAELEDDDG